ncbi:MAG TPA: ABC transporter substrate-binding protein [Candidatus Kapabacteria bacterium]|nr:ABC transporter substrate-binding protein [Candidatus Kapabacteria bacterium]
MKTDTTYTDDSRRSALKKLGLASAAVVTRPILPGFNGVRNGSMFSPFGASGRPVRVALLHPDKGALGTGMVRAGIETFLGSRERLVGRRGIEVNAVNIGYGVNQAIAAARRITKDRSADVVVGMMSPSAARWVRDMFEDGRVPFVAVHAGERIADRAGTSPYLFQSSLGMWQGAYRAGTWAAGNLGSRCAIASSFVESGFDIAPAFRIAFERAGGTIVHSVVTNAPVERPEQHAVVRQIVNAAPDFVLSLHATATDGGFIGAYAASPEARRIPVMNIDPRMPLCAGNLPGGGTIFSRLRTYTVGVWAPAFAPDESLLFASRCRRTGHTAPDAFALLGYDTANLIDHALVTTENDVRELAVAFPAIGFASARGTLSIDQDGGTLAGPHYLMSNAIGARPIALACDDVEILSSNEIPRRHGWVSSYLAV